MTPVTRKKQPTWQIKLGRVHKVLYVRSGGWLGHWLGPGVRSLMLTTIGRRSGKARQVPLWYMRDGDAFVVIGSNAGSDRPPAWLLNLRDRPEAEVQAGREHRRVVAREATGEERARLWGVVKRKMPLYRRYEGMTEREIPVVVLDPA